jgi:uncharacterized protein YnzC (UPF0291/DUF896 family)
MFPIPFPSNNLLRVERNGEAQTVRKQKKKLTPAKKAEKKRMRREYMTIFINGKRKRAKRPPNIDGVGEDEFIRMNADPIWLLQNEMYEELYQWEQQQERKQDASQLEPGRDSKKVDGLDDDLPF